MYFPIPDDEQLFIDKSMPDRIVLTGKEVNIDSNLAIQGQMIVVRATTVNIFGVIKLPSGSVEVFARDIIADNGAAIDVSGETGSPDNTGSRALSGTSPGAAGLPGANGGDGQPGGRIAIFAETLDGNLSLLAKGGMGGGAQSGGNGANGAKGANSVGCGGASTGQPGGASGIAGRPGKGASGGEIEISIYNELQTGQILTDVSGGYAGAPGSHGSAGAGGPGGDGGSEGYYSEENCSLLI